MNKTIHIKNFKIENKQDIQNFFKQSNIFSQHNLVTGNGLSTYDLYGKLFEQFEVFDKLTKAINNIINIPFLDMWANINPPGTCLLYTSPSPRDTLLSRMPSSA